jgi:hypothetical protein
MTAAEEPAKGPAIMVGVADTAPSEAERNDHLNRLVGEMLDAETVFTDAKEKLKNVVEDLARFAPEVSGEVIIETDKFRIVVTRGETYGWDADILEQLYEQPEVPAHIKRKLTVDKKRYDQLPEDEQKLLRPALTIRVGKPKIEVRNLV